MLRWRDRDRHYNRIELLELAAKAEAKGKLKKATEAYRQVLAKEPGDFVIRGKLAGVLAARKDADAAWAQFHRAAQGYREEGFHDKALSLYKQAAGHFPQRVTIWETIADLHLASNRPADAFNTLHRAKKHFRRRSQRDGALSLMRKAHQIAPNDFATAFRLGRLLCQLGRREEGIGFLERFCFKVRGKELRQLRAFLFRRQPTPARAWHWLRALTGDA